MYLTSAQHDQLRTLIMGFEIPYRSYIAEVILDTYHDKCSFSTALTNAQLSDCQPVLNNTIKNQIIKAQKNPDKLFDALQFANNSFTTKSVAGSADVPMLGELNVLTYVFQQNFSCLVNIFPCFSDFFSLARKYSYVRNKLNHPLCKILEDTDMIPVLNFMEEICKWLDWKYFWDKSKTDIIKRITALRTSQVVIPISIQNINDMPFPETRIVCRSQEIAAIKDFIYGKPGAFRKQSSYCIYGYGGLGKTALVLEGIKEIIQDVIDRTTINNYKPEFLLFFSAKERKLTYSQTSGVLESVIVRKTFSTFSELKTQIFAFLQIDNFLEFDHSGIVIVDNLETLSSQDRAELHDFIQAGSPSCIQYILTSRKEEQYDVNVELNGFENDDGLRFINEYSEENDLNLDLSRDECLELLQISKGNTLVLVLCLSRLSRKLETIDSIQADFSKLPTTKTLNNELTKLPPSGFDIISEFMFKNTFEEVELVFESEHENMYKVLRIFTVYGGDEIDIYTISIVAEISCQTVQQITNILCHYLILERRGANYRLNQFAEKYIIQRFLPDAVQYAALQERVERCVRQTDRELRMFDDAVKRNPERQKILMDWNIFTNGDKIAAAKIDLIYIDVREQCNKGNKFFVRTALEDAYPKINLLEKTSIHPYIQYQKARILKMIDDSGILPEKHDEEIQEVYKNVIWSIKTNPLYSCIQHTKSYAAILWIYGMRLIPDDIGAATRYLEDAKSTFEECGIVDAEYVNCLSDLLQAYLKSYGYTKNKSYLHSARPIDRKIMEFSRKPKHFWQWHDELKRY